MWFWFFEARSNPSTAPLVLVLNGGPGCSSMPNLFLESGPCTFTNVSGSTPVLNPHSWNNVANMLYVDQPIGVGFSYGKDRAISTVSAAPFVWKFLQAFYAQFPTYKNRNFGLFTESYGGHYGPEFSSYL
jgi:carboxypeptidase C (cathepsin A)